MNPNFTLLPRIIAHARTLWGRATEPLVPIDDIHRHRAMTSQASMLLAGALIFLLQLIIRVLGLFNPTPYALFALITGIAFNLTIYVLARLNRLHPVQPMIAASLIIYTFIALMRAPQIEILFYPALLVIYSVIHTARAHALLVFAINGIGILTIPLFVPSLAPKIADPLTFYLIVSMFVFVYMDHFQQRLRIEDADRQQRAEEHLKIALQGERHKLVERFVRAFSHYFRNQLAVIETNRYLIPHIAADPQRLQERIDRIGESVNQMREQLDNLRLIMSMDASRAAPCDVNAVLTTLAYDHHYATTARDLTLTAQSDGTAVLIAVDVEHLKSALRQLLLNAMSYTPAGGCITLSARQSAGRAEIRVSDSGSGIDAQRQTEMFDFFVKGDAAMSIDQGGVGVGLSIVKMVADVYHGAVRVTSVVGQGSTFTLTFPLLTPNALSQKLFSDATAAPTPMPMGVSIAT